MIAYLILSLFLLLPLLLAMYFFRNKQLNKLFIVASFLLIALLLLFPAASDSLLAFLGLDSRIEAVTYAAIGLFSFLFVYLYAKFRHLERRQTEFVRMMALRDASTQEQ